MASTQSNPAAVNPSPFTLSLLSTGFGGSAIDPSTGQPSTASPGTNPDPNGVGQPYSPAFSGTSSGGGYGGVNPNYPNPTAGTTDPSTGAPVLPVTTQPSAGPSPLPGGPTGLKPGDPTPPTTNLTPHGQPPAALGTTPTMDASTIGQWVAYWATLPGADPSLTNDPNYWITRIQQTGGLSSANTAYWQGRAQGQGGDTGGGNTTGIGANVAGIQNDPNATALFNELMGLGTGTSPNSVPTDPNNPLIKNQVDAYSAQQQRQMLSREQQFAAAEGPNANLAPEIAAENETAGQNTGQFQSQLMYQMYQDRINQIQQALSTASSMLTTEQTLALQEELAKLQLEQQAYEFDTSQSDSTVSTLLHSGTGA